jgi:hypothetical protein
MHPVSRLVLLLNLALISSGGAALAEHASPSPTKPTPTPTPIPLTTVAVETQSAMGSLQAIDTSLEQSQSSASVIAASLADLTSETDAMMSEDMKLSSRVRLSTCFTG